MGAKLWSNEDTKFLIENYSNNGNIFCANSLNRSTNSISCKAKRLGLKTDVKYGNKVSDEELLSSLFKLSKELDKSPSAVECNNCSYTANVTTYRARFGSWNKAKEAAKLNTHSSNITDEELINSIKAFYNKNGIVPRLRDCTADNSLHGPNTYKDRFGTWEEVLQVAGLTKNKLKSSQETDEELIRLVQEFYIKNKKSPTSLDFSTDEKLKSRMTYYRRFGTLESLFKLADIPYTKDHIKRSIPEIELEEYIKSIYDGEVISSDRTIIKPKELDIVLPDLKLAFEFDGMYWHSTANQPDSKYHLNKTIAAAKAGYTLVHVFESEWFSKQHIVKSRISNLLGSSERVYARKCEVKPLVVSTARVFLEANHLQGYVGASARYGLFYEDELVSVMTFGKPRYNKNVDWELLRFANKCGVSVVGGASRLFKAFTRECSPSTVLSYSDKRWGLGGLYTNLGFEFTHNSAPNYWYLVNGELESRIKYQKHKLDKLLPDFKPELTEKQNMEAAGYYRIYDCGNAVFLWKKEHVTLEK